MDSVADVSCNAGIFEELLNSTDQLSIDVVQAAAAINSHPVFDKVRDLRSARIFMKHHVWCVWDFMSLAKAIQLQLGSFKIPWFPSADASIARAFSELVLSEESDFGPDGRIASHFEIYLEAMNQAGADSSAIRKMLEEAPQGAELESSMKRAGAPLAASAFVASTMGFARGTLHEAAGAFCLGREELLPGITEKLLQELPADQPELTLFRWYLNRHVELDSTSHGPTTATAFRFSTAGSESLRREALTAGLHAIRHRHDYLTAIAEAIER